MKKRIALKKKHEARSMAQKSWRENKHRFKAIEYSSGYAVQDTRTKNEHWISDGVDLLFTPTGKPMKPGSANFLRKLTQSLNSNPEETLAAYFSSNLEVR